MNSALHRSTLPKSRFSASSMAPPDMPSPPRPSKYSSCRIIELVAINSSRLSPLITNPGALAKVELRELCRDGIQPPYRASVVVLPMAEDELLRKPPQLRRVT